MRTESATTAKKTMTAQDTLEVPRRFSIPGNKVRLLGMKAEGVIVSEPYEISACRSKLTAQIYEMTFSDRKEFGGFQDLVILQKAFGHPN